MYVGAQGGERGEDSFDQLYFVSLFDDFLQCLGLHKGKPNPKKRRKVFFCKIVGGIFWYFVNTG